LFGKDHIKIYYSHDGICASVIRHLRQQTFQDGHLLGLAPDVGTAVIFSISKDKSIIHTTRP